MSEASVRSEGKKLPTTMPEVVARFEAEADEAARLGQRWGYFAALYGRMTIEMDRRIVDGFFEDRPRMERLDVRFANAYFEALAIWKTNRNSSELPASWRVAFEACDRDDITVLQHLYLGLTAHLLLDLGVAAARTCPGPALPSLKRDFEKINDVVGELIRDFHRALGRASPLLGTFDRYLGSAWSSSSILGLRVARSMSWSAAERLAQVPEEKQGPVVADIDRRAANIARNIAHPVLPMRPLTRTIRERESNDPTRIIELLRG